jgi:RNA polymerase sigma factor (sigma-70 family)
MSEAAAAAGLSRWQSDERLTRRACGGDERAFAAIFRRYHQPLYRFCMAIVANPEDAQDALQNTMVKVMRALPVEERTIELRPWLYRIAHNEAIDLLRRRRETRQLDVEQAAPGFGVAEDAATRERLRRLLADLGELPERQREVLVMRELGGLGFGEIGAALDASDAVARQTLYEARQSLRRMEEGREMGCEEVTKALSDGDGRVTRRRDIRAHLRSCADCRAFRAEIEGRRRDLAAISPLPAAAVAGMVQGLIGGSGVPGGGGLATMLGGGAAKTISASAAAKGMATIAVAAAVGVGAADGTGAIHLGLPGGAKSQPASTAPATPDGHSTPDHSDGGAGHGAADHPRHAEGERGSRRQAGGREHAGHGAQKAVAGTNPHGESPAHDREHDQQQGGVPVLLPDQAPDHSQTPGPPAEPPAQRGSEEQQSDGAGGGREKAAEKNAPGHESGGGGKSESAHAEKQPKPEKAPPSDLPPGQAKKEPPPNPPPAAAPEPPAQASPPPSASPGKGPEHAAPGSSAGGKGHEAKP